MRELDSDRPHEFRETSRIPWPVLSGHENHDVTVTFYAMHEFCR